MNDNIFGAYGSDPIKIKESFYGNILQIEINKNLSL
jgi:hypothetical protein